MPIDSTRRSPLCALQLIAVADQGDGGQRRKGEWALLFSSVPGEEALHRAFVAPDGACGTIGFLQFSEPEGEDLLFH